MTSRVEILSEPGGVLVVACFVTDPDTKQPHCLTPWVSEHRWRPEALAAASEHRAEVAADLARRGLTACPTCGRKPDASEREGEVDA